MGKILLVSKLQCSSCNDIIVSRHRHDYVTCKCGKLSLDGGTDYRRIIYNTLDSYSDKSIYTDTPFEAIREEYCRGGRGKDGLQPLTWVPLAKMSNEWLENCIKYNIERGLGKEIANTMYTKELEYRRKNKIKIIEE